MMLQAGREAPQASTQTDYAQVAQFYTLMSVLRHFENLTQQ